MRTRWVTDALCIGGPLVGAPAMDRSPPAPAPRGLAAPPMSAQAGRVRGRLGSALLLLVGCAAAPEPAPNLPSPPSPPGSPVSSADGARRSGLGPDRAWSVIPGSGPEALARARAELAKAVDFLLTELLRTYGCSPSGAQTAEDIANEAAGEALRRLAFARIAALEPVTPLSPLAPPVAGLELSRAELARLLDEAYRNRSMKVRAHQQRALERLWADLVAEVEGP